MSLYSSPLDDALQAAGIVQFNAVEIVLPGPITIRLIDGSIADVTFSSKTFKGADATYGTLRGVEDIDDGSGNESPTLSVVLQVPSNAAASTLMQATNQGAAVTHWWGLLDVTTGQPIGTPDQQFSGEIDVPNLLFAQNSRLVQLDCAGVFDRFFDVDEGIGLNHSTHFAIWGAEYGLEFVTDVEVSEPWGQDLPRGILVSDRAGGGVYGPSPPGFSGIGGGGYHGLGVSF